MSESAWGATWDRAGIRREVRVTALRSAARSDAVEAARAAARLRLPRISMSSADFEAAHEARSRLGRAIRAARVRRDRPVLPVVPIPVLPRATSVPWYRALGPVALFVAGSALLLWPPGARADVPGGGSAPAAAPPPAEVVRLPVPLDAQSRGRTSPLYPVIPLVAAAAATPAPSAEPQPEPTAAPQPAPRTAPPAGPVSGGAPVAAAPGVVPGSGGSGGGAGGGVGPGSGPGSGPGTAPTPTPTPTPTPNPTTAIPPGYGSFGIKVTDAYTGRPLAGVCVVIGTELCGPGMPQTDASGVWRMAVPKGRSVWDLRLIKDGYATMRRVIVTTGDEPLYGIRMFPLN